MVMDWSAMIVPTNVEPVPSVAELVTCQKTLQGLAPLMKLRKNRPLLLIDIAVPRDIDPEVNLLNQVYLFNIDDLQQIANDYMEQRREEIAKCESIIQERARALLEGFRRARTSADSSSMGGCPATAHV